jgi:hypothetical protein
MSLLDSKELKTFPLSREMFSIENTDRTGVEGSGSERWRHLVKGRHFDIYENSRVLPRAWMTSEVEVLPEASMLQVIRTGVLPNGSKWDPLRTALVESPLANEPTRPGEPGHVSVTSYRANRIQLETQTNATSFLVLSETDYPGWRAYVDGQSTEIIRTNYALRGLLVPAGKHEITLVYRPSSVLAGLFVSLLTLAGLVWIARRKSNTVNT